MTNPVVVGVDGTGRSLKALIWAAHRASLHRAPVRIVHAPPRYEADFPPFSPGRFEEAPDDVVITGLGVTSVRTLLRRIAEPGAPRHTVKLPTSLVVRASCGRTDPLAVAR